MFALLTLFTKIFALIEVLDKKKNNSAINFVMSTVNTVHFMTAELYGLTNKGKWEKIEDRFVEIEAQMWHNGKLEFRDKLNIKSEKSQFFYTTPNKGLYHCVFSVTNMHLLKNKEKYVEYGMSTSVFSGEANLPVVRSTGEVEVDRAVTFFKQVLDYAKQNLTLQEVEFEDEENYKGIYDGILKVAAFMMILKLLSTVLTIYFSSLKTKQFFEAQNLNS